MLATERWTTGQPADSLVLNDDNKYNDVEISYKIVETLKHTQTRRALGGVHLPPTKVFHRLTGSVNKTMLKALLAAAANRLTYTSDFSHIKFCIAALK